MSFVNASEATKSVEKPNRERCKSGRLVNTFTCTDHDPADVIGLDNSKRTDHDLMCGSYRYLIAVTVHQ